MRAAVTEKNVFVRRARNSIVLSILRHKKTSYLEIKAAASTHRHLYQLKRNGATMAKKQNQERNVVVKNKKKNIKKDNDRAVKQKSKIINNDILSNKANLKIKFQSLKFSNFNSLIIIFIY